MDQQKILLALDELLELDPGTLKGAESLSDFENWDLLAVISFIAFADEEFGIVVNSDPINNAQTVNDLIKLVASNVKTAA